MMAAPCSPSTAVLIALLFSALRGDHGHIHPGPHLFLLSPVAWLQKTLARAGHHSMPLSHGIGISILPPPASSGTDGLPLFLSAGGWVATLPPLCCWPEVGSRCMPPGRVGWRSQENGGVRSCGPGGRYQRPSGLSACPPRSYMAPCYKCIFSLGLPKVG